jgi:amino acid permease
MFAFQGVDIIGLVAEETEKQRETLPRAFRRVSSRIILYSVGAVFVLGLNVSVKDPLLAKIVQDEGFISPFVLMVERTGFPRMTYLVNSVIVVAVAATANIRLYVSVKSFV